MQVIIQSDELFCMLFELLQFEIAYVGAAMLFDSSWRNEFRAYQNSKFCENDLVVQISKAIFCSTSFKGCRTLRKMF